MQKKPLVIIIIAISLFQLAWVFVNKSSGIAEDYFVSKYTTVKFLLSTTQGNSSDLYKYMYYTKTPEGYTITEKGTTNKTVTSEIIRSVIFKNNEVLLTRETNKKAGQPDVTKNYNQPLTLVKIPVAGKTATWSYSLDGTPDNTFFCTANFIDKPVIVNDKPQVFHDLLVMRSCPAMKGKLLLEYYEKGGGLIKAESANADGSDKVVLYERVNL